MSHLHPHSIVYTQPAKDGRPECHYRVEVHYSLHCFTRGLRVDEVPDQALLYTDNYETRIFDFQRWELSHHLPRVVAELMQRKCYHTGRGNFFTIEVTDESGSKADYEVFFKTYLKRAAGKTALILFIQSAYIRDRLHSNRPRRKPIRFSIILYNVLNGKEIKIAQ